MDCFNMLVEECGEGEDFRERFSDDIKEDLAVWCTPMWVKMLPHITAP
jgi:hypothetical protein